jgi:CheY-like chemotaxis protein
MNVLNEGCRDDRCVPFEQRAASGTETHREAPLAPTATPWSAPPAGPARILVAHGDPVLRHRLASALRLYGYAVHEFVNGIDVLQFVADAPLDLDDPCGVDLIIADIRLPGWTGADLLAELRYEGWSTPFLLTAKGGNKKLTASVKKLGMVAVFEEPLDVKDVLVAATRILEDTRLPRFPPVVTCALPRSVGL